MDRDSRTIYVHYGGAGLLPLPKLRPLLEANFGEWGPLQNIHIVPDKTIAFVRYHWRSTAEFAKEAMHGQGLRGSKAAEVLCCRWASDDPNPGVVAARKRDAEQALLDAQAAASERLPGEGKRARLAAAALESGERVSAVARQYPDTDAAYEEAGSGPTLSEAETSTYASIATGVYPDTSPPYINQAVQQGDWTMLMQQPTEQHIWQQQAGCSMEAQADLHPQNLQQPDHKAGGAGPADDGAASTALDLLAAFSSEDEDPDSHGGAA